jgi:hypothetical protein
MEKLDRKFTVYVSKRFLVGVLLMVFRCSVANVIWNRVIPQTSMVLI